MRGQIDNAGRGDSGRSAAPAAVGVIVPRNFKTGLRLGGIDPCFCEQLERADRQRALEQPGKAGSEIALLEGTIADLPGVTMTYELAFLREL